MEMRIGAFRNTILVTQTKNTFSLNHEGVINTQKVDYSKYCIKDKTIKIQLVIMDSNTFGNTNIV